MGALCSCCSGESSQEDLDDIEYTNPSAMAEDSNEGKVVNEKNEHTIYLRIIEDAKKKFLNSEGIRRNGSDSDPIRLRFLNGDFDVSRLRFNDGVLRSAYFDDIENLQSIVEMLSKPVLMERYDMLSDEIAAVVSKHTLSWDLEDVNKVVIPFKPVIQQAVSAP